MTRQLPFLADSAKSIVVGKLRSKADPAINKLLPEDRPAHEWYRFVLSFPPKLIMMAL